MLIAAVVSLETAQADSERDDVGRRLDSLKVSVDFKDVKLEEAIEFLRQATKLNFLVQEGGERRVRLTLRDVCARSVLNLMLRPMGLSAVYREGVVVILPRDKVKRNLECRIYDVRSALVKLRDFPGPKVELTSARKMGGLLIGTG